MRLLIMLASVAAFPGCALAAEEKLNGAELGLIWILPFLGILGSIAIFPLLLPHFWHRHYGLVAFFWSAAFLAPFAMNFGVDRAAHELMHTLLLEYIPFIILIGALFTVAGGVYIGGDLHGSPRLNAGLLLCGTVLASFLGTTGASMILIRPLIRANADRRHNAHVVIFFIYLVSNIGGALTPIGDPPLFLGYLQGVHFLWPLQFLWAKTFLVAAILLAIFITIDSYLYRKEGRRRHNSTPNTAVHIRGLVNVPLIILLIAAVALSGSAKFGELTLFGIEVPIGGLYRDGMLLLFAMLSLLLTPRAWREKNEFSWSPAIEVAKLFAAIFITIIPAIAILRAGGTGALAPLFTILGAADAPNNAAYFWFTGGLSSFLDNAPTYLVFFNAAGGDPERLMGPLAQTLAAISAGAVFMGANTYIGNAPNFMVKAIAEHQGVKMPSFFGYMGWSALFLLPTFALVTFLFFR